MRLLFVATVPLVIASQAADHTRETAIVAAMRLSESPNYSWTCTITDDARTYDIDGKTQNGYTWQRQPMPKVVARRLGRSAGHELESIFSAPLRYVIQTETGWKTLEELPKQHGDWNDDDWYYVAVPAPIIRTADMPADAADDIFGGTPPVIYVPAMPPEQDKEKVFSNAQFALALPHEELGVIVSSHAIFEVEGNTATGALTDLGAQLLLVHEGHEYIMPVTAGGRFKLWLSRDGVEKYRVELVGIVVVDRKPIYVQQQATTVIQDVGTTVVDVPPDARRRL